MRVAARPLGLLLLGGALLLWRFPLADAQPVAPAAVEAGAVPALPDAAQAGVGVDLQADAGIAAKISRREFLERQLATSLDRRAALERGTREMHAYVEAQTRAPPVPVAPVGLIEIDNLRREVQQIDQMLEQGARRAEVLGIDREAAAREFEIAVAAWRNAQDTEPDSEATEMAHLEARFAEARTAEGDALVAVVNAHQSTLTLQRRQVLARLALAPERVAPSSADIEALRQRLDREREELEARLARAATARDRAVQALAAAPPDDLAGRRPLQARVENQDIELELAREALSNVDLERAVWEVALRFFRDGDAAALAESRSHGFEIRASAGRRLEFLRATADQVLAQLGAVDAELAAAGAAAPAALRTLRDVHAQRLAMLHAGILNQRQLVALIDRLGADFERRIDSASAGERIALAWATLRSGTARIWNAELFSVQQGIELDGRKTAVERSVTLGKLIQAPLILLLGLWFSYRITGWAERFAVRRRGAEEGRARLVRRWTWGLLAVTWAVISLAIAGIPLATFAFIGGAVAIGVGFGMQNLFKNLISGVLVLIERPFKLGDVIEIGGLRGTVVDIDLRASVVRDGDGAETLIPNSALIEQNVKNVTFRSRLSRQNIVLTLAASVDPRAAIDTMIEAVARHGLVSKEREPSVTLDEASGDGLRFVLHYWIELAPGNDARRIASDLRLMILGALHDQGFALAQTTTVLTTAPEAALASKPAPVPAMKG